MKAARDVKGSMTVPGSLTDLMKALRELIGLMKDTGELISGGVRVYDRRRSKKAAERLYGLAFTPQGMRGGIRYISHSGYFGFPLWMAFRP